MWYVPRLYNEEQLRLRESLPYFNVTSGGIGVVREHQLQKSPTPPFYQRRNNEIRKKKQKS
jgi:hypothetical protein